MENGTADAADNGTIETVSTRTSHLAAT
jgi:hypothetical protein